MGQQVCLLEPMKEPDPQCDGTDGHQSLPANFKSSTMTSGGATLARSSLVTVPNAGQSEILVLKSRLPKLNGAVSIQSQASRVCSKKLFAFRRQRPGDVSLGRALKTALANHNRGVDLPVIRSFDLVVHRPPRFRVGAQPGQHPLALRIAISSNFCALLLVLPGLDAKVWIATQSIPRNRAARPQGRRIGAVSQRHEYEDQEDMSEHCRAAADGA